MLNLHRPFFPSECHTLRACGAHTRIIVILKILLQWGSSNPSPAPRVTDFVNRVWQENKKPIGKQIGASSGKAKRAGEIVWPLPHTVSAHALRKEEIIVCVAENVRVCVCVCFTIHDSRFDGLNAGHDFRQVSEGSVGTCHHLIRHNRRNVYTHIWK